METKEVINEDQIYNFESEFGIIRCTRIFGEPYMVGKDIAICLGYTDTNKILRKYVPDDEKLVRQIGGTGQLRSMTFIAESGLYRLAFSSKMPKAKEFTTWVVKVVLPSIRKDGGYVASTKEQFNPIYNMVSNINFNGNKQQQLNALIREYAATTLGGDFKKGYELFVRQYNCVFHTNLNLRKDNYCKTHGLDYISTPEYLNTVGEVDNGIYLAIRMFTDIKVSLLRTAVEVKMMLDTGITGMTNIGNNFNLNYNQNVPRLDTHGVISDGCDVYMEEHVKNDINKSNMTEIIETPFIIKEGF